tara:strand:+ start:170 stop:904 length:735 start_codon:yes stop_codon:yes gene_type:complete
MIFNLFKAKPTLKELIPDGFVDIHSHILPGIDDGATNIEESLKLITEMKKIGFGKIIATPHTYTGLYDNTVESIKKSFDKINKVSILKSKLSYASEYLIDNSIILKANNQTLLTIKDNFVLIEFSFAGMPINTKEILFELQTNGYIPILAHPERYDFLFNAGQNKLISELKKFGCYFQLNLFSLIGYYGNKVLWQSQELLKNNIIDFVGSDIHRIDQISLFEKKIKIKNYKALENLAERNEIFL